VCCSSTLRAASAVTHSQAPRRSAVELGCGAAACAGIVAARLGCADVLLTDADDAALQLARANAARNGAVPACRTQRLMWGVPPEEGQLDATFELVLAAEVVYACAPARALAATAVRLLARSGGVLLLLAHQERFALSLDSGEVRIATRDEALDAFCSCLRDAGLQMRELARRPAGSGAPACDGALLLLAASRDAAAIAALPLFHAA
jgi:ribosomal protein L11 methylase PrmA